VSNTRAANATRRGYSPALRVQLAAAKPSMAKELLQRQIDATDGQIDWLGY